MSIVDNRIVKMGFDNKDFEKKVDQTTKSLEKLDNAVALEDGASKCEQSCSAINAALHGLDIQAVNTFVNKSLSSFTVWGKTISKITTEIANTAFNDLKGLFTNIPNLIQTGGRNRAQNIESARFQLKGLGMDVDTIMEDANYAVQGTAYGLDQAAKAAAQFGASGIQAGDEMKTALRSISGVAAMTNTDFEEISRIFTAIAGQGKVQTIRLQQLSSRGLAVSAKLAEAYGVTEAELSEMVTKGKVDAKSFFRVMDNAFGEHATKANETYAGSLGNVKAALSRIGEKFETKKLDSFRRIFVSMIPVINSFKTELMPFIDGWNELFETWTSRIEGFFKKINEYQLQMKDGETILTKISKIALGVAEDFNKLLSAVQKGVIDGLQFSIENLDKAITRVNDIYQKLRPSMETFTTISQIFARMVRTGKNLLNLVSQIVGALFDALTGSTGAGLLDAINGLAGAIAYFTSKLILSESAIESLKKIFTGVISAGKLILRIINPIINLISGLIIGLTGIDVAPGVDGLLGLLSVIAEFITKLDTYVRDTGIFDSFSEFVLKVGKVAGSVIRKIWEVLKNPIKSLGTSLKNFFDGAIGAFDLNLGIDQWGKVALDKIKQFGNKILNSLKKIWNKIKGFFTEIFEWASNKFFKTLQTGLKDTGEAAETSSSGWDKLLTTIKVGLIGVGAGIASITASVGVGIITIINRLTKPLKGIGDVASGVGDVLSAFASKLSVESFTSKAKSFGSMIMDIAKAFAILAASLFALSLIDPNRLKAVKDAVLPFFALGVGVAALITQIRSITQTKKMITSFSNTLKGISEAIKSVANINKPAPTKMTFADVVKLMTSSLLKFAVAALILSKVYKNNKEGFIAATAAIGGFMIILSVLSGILVKITKTSGDMKNLGTVVKSLASSMTIFAIALRILIGAGKGYAADQVWVAVGILLAGATALGGLMAVSVGLLKVLTSIKVTDAELKTLKKVVNLVNKFAIAMIPMAASIALISRFASADQAIATAGAISLVLVAFMGIVLSAKLLKDEDLKKLDTISAFAVAIGAMIGLLAGAIWVMQGVEWSGGIISFLIAMGVFIGALIGIVFAISKGTKNMTEDEFMTKMLALSMVAIAMAGSLALIAVSMKPLAQYSWGSLLTLVGMIAVFMGGIIGVMFAMKKIQKMSFAKLIGVGAMLVSLGVGIAAIASASTLLVSAFKDLNTVQTVFAFLSIIGIMALLIVLINVASEIPIQAVAILEIISEIALAIGAAVYLIGAGIEKSLTPIQQLLDFISLILQSIDKLIWLAANIDQVKYACQQIIDNFNTLADGIAKGLNLAFDKAIGGTIEKIREYIPAIQKVIKEINEAIWESRDDIASIIIGIGQILSVTIGAVIAAVISGIWTSLVMGLENIVLTIGNLAPKFGDVLGNSISVIFYSIADFLANHMPEILDAMGQSIKALFMGLSKTIMNSVSSVLDDITGALNMLPDKVKNFGPVKAIISGLSGASAWARAKGTEETEIKGFKEAQKKQDELNKEITDLKDTVSNAWSIFSTDGDQSLADKVLSAIGIKDDGSGTVGDKIKGWLEEQGLSNLFGESDIASKFASSTESDTGINKTIAGLVSDIAGNTAATASNTDKIKNNTEEMTVSLDSGQVVGAIAPDMYDALGRIRTQKGRGN